MAFAAAQKLHLLLPTSDGTQSQEFKDLESEIFKSIAEVSSNV